MMSPNTPAPRVAAAIATHRREAELTRLLEALQASETPFAGGIFVADNAAAPGTRDVCAANPGAVWIPRAVNNGPGPAWNAAIAKALENPQVTHVLVLDDDVVLPPAALRQLLEAMQRARVAAAAPLLCDGKNHLWAFPEPVAKDLRTVIRRCIDPDECRRALGDEPHAFCWATGACMLYARRAFETAGFFREDFWMLGEDLEFSMRVASGEGGIFTARTVVPHLPPPADAATSQISHRLKFLALLQNLSYLAFHSPHSAHLRSYLAGNFKRYARTEGLAPGTLWDAWCAFYEGALLKQPAGTPAGARLRQRARRRLGP